MDGRAAFGAIGESVGLSASAVKRRVDRLRASGRILGFTVTVEHPETSGPLEAFVEHSCAGKVAPDRLRAMFRGVPEVRSAYTVAGDADAILHVTTADMTEFERVLERLRDHPGVARTRSTIVLSRLCGPVPGTTAAPAPGNGESGQRPEGTCQCMTS